MPQSTEGSAPPPVPTKTLARGPDGKFYVIVKNAPTVELTTQAPAVQAILDDAERRVTDSLNQSGPSILASGVRIRITELF